MPPGLGAGGERGVRAQAGGDGRDVRPPHRPADAGERELWWIDPDAAVAAEIGAALSVSQGMAMQQTHRGVALRDRLPSGGGVVRGRGDQRSAGAHHRVAHLR